MQVVIDAFELDRRVSSRNQYWADQEQGAFRASRYLSLRDCNAVTVRAWRWISKAGVARLSERFRARQGAQVSPSLAIDPESWLLHEKFSQSSNT
jgi:hypothetical protein